MSLSTTRLGKNGDKILFLLLRTCQDLTSEENTNDQLSIIRDCVIMLKLSAPNQFEELIDLRELQFTERVYELALNTCQLE